MKNEIPCAVIRDLLPSFTDGLTENETTEIIKKHLETCDDCRRRYENMSSSDENDIIKGNPSAYPESIKKKNTLKIAFSVIAALLVVILISSVYIFLIGIPVNTDTVKAEAENKDGNINITFTVSDSGTCLRGIKSDLKNGTAYIKARSVLASPFHKTSENDIIIPAQDTEKVAFGDKTLWQNGIIISDTANELIENQTASIESTSDINKLINILDYKRPFTIELETKDEPYGLIFHLEESPWDHDRIMSEKKDIILIALIGNLSKISRDAPDGSGYYTSVEDITASLPSLYSDYNSEAGTNYSPLNNIKDYATDIYNLQILMNILGL